MAKRRIQSPHISLFSFQDIITATTGILVLLALVLALSVVIQKSAAQPTDSTEDVSALKVRISELNDEIEKMTRRASAIEQHASLISSMSPDELRNRFNSHSAGIDVLTEELQSQADEIRKLEDEFAQSEFSKAFKQLEVELDELKRAAEEASKDLNDLKSQNRVIYNFRATTSPPILVEIDKEQLKAKKANSKDSPKLFKTVRAFMDFAKGVPANERYFVLLLKPSGIENFELARPYLEQINADLGIELLGEDETAMDNESGGSFK